MSMTHVLVKIDHGEMFDLGKGLGSNILPDAFSDRSDYPFILPDFYRTPTDLADRLAVVMKRGDWDVPPPGPFIYANKLAEKIFYWAGHDRLVILPDDQGDPTGWFAGWFSAEECRSIKFRPAFRNVDAYKLVGSRYDL